jgi:hypothetical protein
MDVSTLYCTVICCFIFVYILKPFLITFMWARIGQPQRHFFLYIVGEERKVYKVLVGKPEGKRPLGRPRRRWEDGIRMDLREIGLGGVDWIRLSHIVGQNMP